MADHIRLSVNLNKVALVRNSREGDVPSLLAAAKTVIAAGAEGITVHPRPDQRHVRPDDVLKLGDLLRNCYPGIEFNIEGNPTAGPTGTYPGFLQLVYQARPDQCTLVPDSPGQLTSDHGFDLREDLTDLLTTVKNLQARDIRVSIFMDPDPEQIRLAPATGTDRIELYTGPYAEAFGMPQQAAITATFRQAARIAADCGLGLNAGHDLNQKNLPLFATMPGLLEVSIGHALVSEALWTGLADTVTAYAGLLRSVRQKQSQSAFHHRTP